MRANTSATLARQRGKVNSLKSSFNGRMKALRQRNEAQRAVGLASVGAGAVLGGQIAKRQLFVDDEGKSRAKWVNFALGLAGFGAIVTGRARTEGQLIGACVAAGCGLAQLTLWSYMELDVLPTWGDGK